MENTDLEMNETDESEEELKKKFKKIVISWVELDDKIKLIKQLNENKEFRKLQEKVVKPAVRIQQVKNNLIILAHDLLVSKKINDSLYRKIQLLTYSKTSEKKLNESYDTLKKLKTTVKKSEQLQGPVKTKKITVTDFKNENKFKKSVKELNETLAKKADKLKNLVSYKGFLNDKQDNIYFRFYNFITDDYLYKVSEEYLKQKHFVLPDHLLFSPKRLHWLMVFLKAKPQ